MDDAGQMHPDSDFPALLTNGRPAQGRPNRWDRAPLLKLPGVPRDAARALLNCLRG
jgi:hypothetical protein